MLQATMGIYAAPLPSSRKPLLPTKAKGLASSSTLVSHKETGTADVQIEQDRAIARPWGEMIANVTGNRVMEEIPQRHNELTGQCKLMVGCEGDRYEREADRVAAEVVQNLHTQVLGKQPVQTRELIAAPIPRPSNQPRPSRELRAKSLTTYLDNTPHLDNPGTISSTLERSIYNARGRGQPLNAGLQQSMGQAMGVDFRQVRVHTDNQAHALNQSIQAKAFTTGQDLFFRQGFYNPDTQSGQTLIAHELTHVVQQQENSEGSQATLTNGLIQRAIYGSGDQSYTTTPFLGTRERPTQVVAKIHSHKVGQRGRTPIAISLLHDPSDPTGMSDAKLGFDGGHILGLSLGGDDESYNIVPMYPGFNRGTWKNVENQIENDAIYAFSGMNFGVTIDIQYAGVNKKTPSSLSAKGYADKTDKKSKKTTRKQVKNYGTKTQPIDIATTSPLTPSDADIVTANQPDKALNKIIKKAALSIRNDLGDTDGANYLLANQHLAASQKTDYPDEPDERPYEYLDILTFAHEMNPNTSLGTGRLFSNRQRELILQANMAANHGVLISDDVNDPHAILSEQGAANFPEIDHIIPKSLGGSNMFSNARVVSWQLNNKEDRIKDISGLVDVSRLALPAMPSGTIAEKAEIIVPRLVIKENSPITIQTLALKITQNYSSVKPIKANSAWWNAIQTVLDDKVASGEFTKDPIHNTYQVV